jgi:molecular chaperone GrpE
VSKKQTTTEPESQGTSEPQAEQSPPAEEPADSELLEAHREAFEAADEVSNGDESCLDDLSPEEQIEKLRAQVAEAKDQALRSQAELENFRKRATRQMDEERRYASMPMIRDLLPVLDNIGRAIDAAEQSHDTSSLLEGFKMTAEQLESALARHHCVEIEALHQSFDPNVHEAISQLPNDEHPAGTVSHVTQIGFLLHDRVVRPSQVVVSSGSPQEDQDPETRGATEQSIEENDEQPT